MPTTVPLSEVPYFPFARANEQESPSSAVAAKLNMIVAAKTITSPVADRFRFQVGLFMVFSFSAGLLRRVKL
jgi:hypothetical protein